ncbi:MAG: hypothetical protein NVS1B13_01000 [Flavisolibacter sp.]
MISIAASTSCSAQYLVKGTVLDSSRRYPVEAVSVLSSNGRGTMTDSLGHYQIDVREKDSVWFSYLGKSTPKFPVLKIADVTQFDIALRLKMDILQEVKVRTRNYKLDSIQNRRDYQSIFSYHKPGLSDMTSIGPTGAGINLDELIGLFQFKKNKATLKFQQRLIDQERQKSVDHRFNKPLVRRITGLDGQQLVHFMELYRPSYEFISYTSEYDFQLYIKKAFQEFRHAKPF